MESESPHLIPFRWAYSLYALSYVIQTTFGIYITLYFSTYFRFVLHFSTVQMAIFIGIQVIQIGIKIPLSRLILSRLWLPRNRRWLQGLIGGSGIVIMIGCLLLRFLSVVIMYGGLVIAISLIYIGLASADTTVDTVFISLHKSRPIPLALGQQIAGLVGVQIGGLLYRTFIGTDFLTGDWTMLFTLLAVIPGLYMIGTFWFSKKFSAHLETITKNFVDLYTSRTFLPPSHLSSVERRVIVLFGAFLIFSNVGYLVNTSIELLITERFGSAGFTIYATYALYNYLITILCSIGAIFLHRWLLRMKYLIIVINGIVAAGLFFMYIWSPLLVISITTVIYGIIPAFYNIVMVTLMIEFTPPQSAAIYYQIYAALIGLTRIGLDALGIILSGIWGYSPLFLVTVGCLVIPLIIMLIFWHWERNHGSFRFISDSQ